MDTKRNRLVVWGGGHNDYYGNEVYALNLNAPQSMVRLNDPSPHSTVSNCGIVANPDGSSKSRHTYDGLAYLPVQDKMFVFGGSVSCLAGGLTNDTWLLDFATLKWEQMSPTGTIPNAAPGAVTAYDPNSGRVFLHTDWNLYSYDPATNAYQQHANNNAIDYHMTGVIDPVRKRLVIIGGGQAWSYDLTTYTRTAIPATGAQSIVSASYPGLVYHAPSDRVVAWAGGNTIYSLDANNVWTATTYPGGPGPAQGNGTYKRFNFSPALGAFVLVNSVDQNGFILRP